MNDVLEHVIDIAEQKKNELTHQMKEWALENDLYTEFMDEVVHSKHYPKFDVDALVKRFGYFVIEHECKSKELSEMRGRS